MAREKIDDLIAFIAVAKVRSFTKAAAQLGVSQSALSHAMRGLEERLGVRLLTRTTRSVAPTEAGERLISAINPHLDGISAGLATLGSLREQPAGSIRISASEHAARFVLYPALARLIPEYPDIKVEVSVDNALTDIVANGFDAGIRLGEHVERDMIAVRIAPDMRMAVIGTPGYFARHAKPKIPQDLTGHNCINMRLPTLGGRLPWEFEKNGREINVRPEGQLVFNSTPLCLSAALDGLGLGYCPDDMVERQVRDGQMIRVLEDWCAPFPGHHLYYPSRRQQSPAFAILVDLLRYRG
jgi:DNA-binding transcriptional LysR family regulator